MIASARSGRRLRVQARRSCGDVAGARPAPDGNRRAKRFGVMVLPCIP